MKASIWMRDSKMRKANILKTLRSLPWIILTTMSALLAKSPTSEVTNNVELALLLKKQKRKNNLLHLFSKDYLEEECLLEANSKTDSLFLTLDKGELPNTSVPNVPQTQVTPSAPSMVLTSQTTSACFVVKQLRTAVEVLLITACSAMIRKATRESHVKAKMTALFKQIIHLIKELEEEYGDQDKDHRRSLHWGVVFVETIGIT